MCLLLFYAHPLPYAQWVLVLCLCEAPDALLLRQSCTYGSSERAHATAQLCRSRGDLRWVGRLEVTATPRFSNNCKSVKTGDGFSSERVRHLSFRVEEYALLFECRACHTSNSISPLHSLYSICIHTTVALSLSLSLSIHPSSRVFAQDPVVSFPVFRSPFAPKMHTNSSALSPQ